MAGRSSGQEVLRKEMVDLASLFSKNDVACKAYTRVLSHTCDTHWSRKLDICRPNGRKKRPARRRISEWDDAKNATWWREYVTLKISICCEDLGQYVACWSPIHYLSISLLFPYLCVCLCYIQCIYTINYGPAGQKLLRKEMVDLASLFLKHDVA